MPHGLTGRKDALRGLAAILCAIVLATALAPSAHAEPTGHQLFFGPAYQGPPPSPVAFAPSSITANGSIVPVTVYLHRAEDAGALHPPALSFDVLWDPAVLGIASPAAVAKAPLMVAWYDKQMAVNFSQAGNGILSISITGGVTFDPDTFDAYSTEITTFDNQLPMIAPEGDAPQQNPFPLLTIHFQVKGRVDESTPLAFQGAILSDQNALALPNQGALDSTVVISGAFPPTPPGAPTLAPFSLTMLILVLLALTLTAGRGRAARLSAETSGSCPRPWPWPSGGKSRRV